MSGAIPALGYPSRTAAALALKAEGLNNGQIADRLGIEKKKVNGLISSSDAIRQNRTSQKNTTSSVAMINPDIRRMLRPHAEKRELTVDALLVLLIERVAEESLVDAVMDDEGVEYK
ncbi:hypothetical protein ACXHXM_02120